MAPLAMRARIVRLPSAAAIMVACAVSSASATPALTVSQTTVMPGQTLAVTFTGGPANARDWIGLYLVGGANAEYGSWCYLNGTTLAPTSGLSSGTVTFTLPSALGHYEFRLLANDGFGLLATSPTVTVASAENYLSKYSTGGAVVASSIYETGDGNVGIGTSSPGTLLDIQKDSSSLSNGSVDNYALTVSAHGTYGTGVYVGDFGYANYAAIQTFNQSLSLNPAGNYVGIGTATPSAALSVNGDVTVSGNISARYQDVAEWVQARDRVSPGTVVVVSDREGEVDVVHESQRSYDTAVAGIVSAQPGLALGEKGPGRVLVATTGRVRVKIDASYGAVHAGDLLVTSPTPGYGMRSNAVDVGGVQFHRPGTVLGKALEPLDRGQGEILVLLTLQ